MHQGPTAIDDCLDDVLVTGAATNTHSHPTAHSTGGIDLKPVRFEPCHEGSGLVRWCHQMQEPLIRLLTMTPRQPVFVVWSVMRPLLLAECVVAPLLAGSSP